MRRLGGILYRFVGPAVFLGLLYFTDLTQVKEIWRKGRPLPIAISALLSIVVILVKTLRWRRLMSYQGIHYAFAPAARYYAIASALGAWTPGRLGDFSKAVAVQRDCHVGLGRAASSVIADRLADAVLLGAVATVGAAFLPGPHALWLAAAGGVAVLLGSWIVFHKTRSSLAVPAIRRGAERIVGVADRTIRSLGAKGGEIGEVIDGLVVLARPRRGLTFLATVAAALVVFLQGYLMARSLGLNVGFWTLSVALSAVSIGSLVPISVAGFGTREAMLALFLVPAGVTMPQIIGFSLAYFVIISGTLALIGAAAWVFQPETKVRVTS